MLKRWIIILKTPDVSNFVTKTALTTVENKTPSVSSLVKKTDYNAKITEINNKLNSHSHDNLVAKSNLDNGVSSLDSKITENKTKSKSIENELKKLKTLDLSYFIGKSHLVFQPLLRYFKLNAGAGHISSWESKWLSAETIEPPSTSDIVINPKLNFYDTKIRVKFSRS